MSIVAAGLALTVLALVGDGLDTRLGPLRISARSPARTFFLASAACVALVLVLDGPSRRRMAQRLGGRALSSRLALGCVSLIAAGVLGVGVVYGSFAASGADAYGYISEAEHLARGSLFAARQNRDSWPWPDAVSTWTPLGYRPAESGSALVPTCLPSHLRRGPTLRCSDDLRHGGAGDLARGGCARRLSQLAELERFVEVPRLLRDRYGSNVVCLTRVYSGSIPYYSGLPTLRWDILAPEWLDAALEAIRERGFVPLILIEEDEEQRWFESRFADTSAIGRLDWAPSLEYSGFEEVRVYDPRDRERSRRGESVVTVKVRPAPIDRVIWRVPCCSFLAF
ncbi:MAG: hypothetical protein ABR606_18245 [Vicinamibacterales bacterium]